MAMSNKQRLFWDANVWIPLSKRDEEPERFETCIQLLRELDAGKVEIVVTPLILAEFRPTTNHEAERLFSDYLKRSSIIFVNINRTIGEKARELMGRLSNNGQNGGLQGADAIHLACALYANADYLHTYDEKHLLRISEQVTECKICKPYLPIIDKEGPLFK